MVVSRYFLALAWLVVWSAPTQAVDLTKIDRTIAKEPAYNTKPKYCLLAFGLEAKARIWLVQDGDTLYVDRNGNGDLTEKGEQCRAQEPQDEIARKHGYKPSDGYRVWQVGDILEPGGKTKHTKLTVAVSAKGCSMRVLTHGERREYVVGGNDGPLHFADRPQDAPIVHFAGPLGIFLRKAVLLPGKEGYVWAALGTPGLGKGAFAIIYDALYFDVEVLAEIDFPGKDAHAERIKVKTVLTRY